MELRLPWIILIFTIFMISGSPAAASPIKTMQASTAATTTETIPKYAFYLCIEITNYIFNNSLLNPESKDYKQMYARVSTALQEIYNCSSCGTQGAYQGIAAMTFSNGSVIANSTIVFQTVFINPVLVKSLFMYKVSTSGPINGLQINQNYTRDVVTPVPAPIPTTGYTTTTPLTTTTPTTKPANTTTTYNTTTATSQHPGNTTTSSAPTSRNPINLNSTTSPYKYISKYPAELNSTTTKPFTSTAKNHTANVSISISSHTSNTSTSTTTTRKTEASSLQTTNAPVTGGGVYYYKGVPGWAIALLVLACIILLLLIIILIIMLIRWCCEDKKPEPETPQPILPEQHTPYERKTFKEPLSTPMYSPQTPQKKHIPTSPLMEDPAKPRVNRTGMYVVNPES